MKTVFLKICAFVLLFSLSGIACEKEDSISVCGINDPLNNLHWLRDIKTSLEENNDINSAQIILYKLDNVDYIYVQKSIALAYDFPNTIYDCEGNEKFNCGGNQPIDACSTFFFKAEKITILWGKEVIQN